MTIIADERATEVVFHFVNQLNRLINSTQVPTGPGAGTLRRRKREAAQAKANAKLHKQIVKIIAARNPSRQVRRAAIRAQRAA